MKKFKYRIAPAQTPGMWKPQYRSWPHWFDLEPYFFGTTDQCRRKIDEDIEHQKSLMTTEEKRIEWLRKASAFSYP